MSNIRFIEGVQFAWQGNQFIVRARLAQNRVRLENVETGIVHIESSLKLVQSLFDGQLLFENNYEVEDAETYRQPELSAYPPEDVEEARFKLSIIQPLLENKLTRAEVKAYVEEQKQRYPDVRISTTSVYRWKSDYEASGYDLRSLIRKIREAPNSLLQSEVDEIIASVIDAYLLQSGSSAQPQLPSAKEIHQEVVLRVEEVNATRPGTDALKAPSRRTISRRIAQQNPVDLYAARYGEREASRKYRQYGRAPQAKQPLERVEIDHTILDMILVDDEDRLPLGRPTFTILIDNYTRYPLGAYIGFEPPSYYTVKAALYHAILPKTGMHAVYGTENDWLSYGLFDELVVDNGKEFVGQDLRDACAILGITLSPSPVAMPWFKAGVERAFRTYNSNLFHSIPGTTFSNVLERGDYKSMAQSVITLSEAKQIFFTYVVDIYAQDFHKGLRDIPAQKWQAAIDRGFSPRVPTDPNELYVALGRVTERVVHHYGVKLLNLRYNLVGNDDLAHLRAQLDGKKVKVKYHPDDLSRIHIINPFNHQIIELPAIDQDYTRNLSLWKHRVILKETKREGQVDVAALGRARRRIQSIIDESRGQKKLQARKKVARWEEPEKQPLQADRASLVTQVEPSHETEDRREAYRKRMAELNKLVEDVSDEGWETGPSLSDLNRRYP